ncbi:hypothetical protein JCGZ_04666 [Jatropha curcas]|uniref:NmrA-like domain-containing protein n=1 Tax=Jatropha curcas TaxID=180498 RepID=A0A067KSP1_JATCU|nr:hypothetical protein JCGZ_04666 [Jatropha curcas]
MAEKNKVLVVEATGHIGKFIVEASSKLGHPTFAFVRELTISNPNRSNLIHSFKSSGVTILYGDIYNHESLVKAIKQVDVVISAVGGLQVPDQTKIIAAIKEAGNVSRFLPSEFGTEVDRSQPVEPAATFFRQKVNIRRAIEAAEIHCTYIVSSGFAGFFLPTLGQAMSKLLRETRLSSWEMETLKKIQQLTP